MIRTFKFTPAQLGTAVALTQYCTKHRISCSMLTPVDDAHYSIAILVPDVARLVSYYLADGNCDMLAYIAGQLNDVATVEVLHG